MGHAPPGMPETLEAEVIEIDGKAPEPAPKPTQAEGYSERARRMVVQLDRRWWPLWALLGVLAVGLLLTVGLAFGVCYLAFALIRGVLRTLGFGASR